MHQWAAINTTELSELLHWCAHHPQQLKKIGEKARKAMFSQYKQESIAEDVMNRIAAIKTKIAALGWEHVIAINQQRISLRKAEIDQLKSTRNRDQVQKDNEKLEMKLKSIVSTFDMVNHGLDKVSEMMSLFQSMMEGSLLEKRGEKEPTFRQLSGTKPRTENVLLNSPIKNSNL